MSGLPISNDEDKQVPSRSTASPAVAGVKSSTAKVVQPSQQEPKANVVVDPVKPSAVSAKSAADGIAKTSQTKTANKKNVLIWIGCLAVILVLAFLGWSSVPSNGAQTPRMPVPTTAVEETTPPAKQDVVEAPSQLSTGDFVITRDSGMQVMDTVSKIGTFTPVWPDGTNQTSVGYSNPEEYPDGRTFMTRSQSNGDEIMAFVAKCVSVNGGPKRCQNESAIVGLIIGSPDGEYPVTLWDAELKTLTIPGGPEAWKAYIYELALFISANKGGGIVEILGPAISK